MDRALAIARWATTWRGTVGRGPYAAVGVSLVAVKYVLDRLLAAAFDRTWTYLDYWSPSAYAIDALPRREWPFFVALLALAFPFAVVGVSLTVRRLRDAGLPPALVALFFVPIVNLVFFAVLSLLPTRPHGPRAPARPSRLLSRLIPGSKVGSALAGIALTGALGLALVALATEGLENYGWGLFVGVPFSLGLLSTLIHGYHAPRPLGEALAVGVAAAGLATFSLLAVGLEGLFCIAMAVPLTVPLAVLGSLTGYVVQSRAWSGAPTAHSIGAVVALLPVLLGVEAESGRRPAVLPVTTSIVVDAPREIVWTHVVAFPELPPPREVYFRNGIAYPVGARIDGRGVGAVRRCSFSTGDFVEPITAWDEPRLLRFDVRAQPPPMREVSPWGDIRPPHLDGFLLSHQGEFRLTALPGGRTLLEGTTWYENRMWPEPFWRLWSDALIHRIHLRVLRHVALLAERDIGGAPEPLTTTSRPQSSSQSAVSQSPASTGSGDEGTLRVTSGNHKTGRYFSSSHGVSWTR